MIVPTNQLSATAVKPDLAGESRSKTIWRLLMPAVGLAWLFGMVFLLLEIRDSPVSLSLTAREKAHARAQAATLLNEVDLGMGYGDVLTILAELEWRPELIERGLSKTGNGWIAASTPLEIGASNWLVVLKFTDGSLNSVELGTADSSARLPHDIESAALPIRLHPETLRLLRSAES